jgi:ATP-dependent exoDNAse (exonuclease V) alpha subunit
MTETAKETMAQYIARLRAEKAARVALAAATPAVIQGVKHDLITVEDIAAPAPVVLDSITAVTAKAVELLTLPIHAPVNLVTTPSGITLNEAQSHFVKLASDLSDPTPVLLLGPAGTGKTTAISALFQELFKGASIPTVQWKHKHLPANSMGAVVVAFTRRATTNVRRRMPKDIQPNAITIHKLLEYAPVDEDIVDKETGKARLARVFRPMRDRMNKQPDGLRLLIVEEVSMLGLMLEANIMESLPPGVKLILVGDICQLVPVMDQPAIAKYLLKVPTIELTEVYRQALDSPIISLATDIRRGKVRVLKEMTVEEAPNGQGKLTLQPWKKRLTIPQTNHVLGERFLELYKQGKYDPIEDQILIPFNKDGTVGAIELNRHIGTMLARAAKRDVFQIIAGFETKHFSVGDSCIYDKADCEILAIEKNKAYMGKSPTLHSPTLDYWGLDPMHRDRIAAEIAADDADHLLFMTSKSFSEDGEKRATQASHRVKIRLLDTDEEQWISGAGEINKLDLAYAMTVHKAQGSEWDRVYVIIHHTHNVSLSRELLYTAVTRAKKELHVICERDTFVTGVLAQVIKGETLEAKAKHLQLKIKVAAASVKQAAIDKAAGIVRQ